MEGRCFTLPDRHVTFSHTFLATIDRNLKLFPKLGKTEDMTIDRHPPSIDLRYILAVVVTLSFGYLKAQNDLFISEYLESAGNKCIEIFNPTNSSINLSGVYRIRMGFNGGALITKSNLTGSISPKQTHVVCTSGSSFAYDQSMGAVGHNGNDVVVLEKNMIPIDIVGNIGCDPGVAWTAPGLSTTGMSLVRKGCVTVGMSNDPPDSPCNFPTLSSEWVGFAAGTSRLGSHGFLYGGLSINEIDPTNCGGDDGEIIIQANGEGLEYSINGTAGPFTTSGIFNNLMAGSYEVIIRVSDDPGCFLTGQATLDEGPLPVIQDIDSYDPSDCNLNDGSILITASGVNLEYSINNGSSFQSSPTFTGLAPDSYDLVIREISAINCIDNTTVVIHALSDPELQSINLTDVSDCGTNDGSIMINATPVGLEYSIDNGSSWSASPTFPNLPGGVYPIVVRKSSAPACMETGTASINAPSPPVAQISSINDADCKGSANGSITLSVAGGTGSYQYNWSGPSLVGNVATALYLSAGDYYVTVSDMSYPGCQDMIDQIRIAEPTNDPPIPNLMPFPDLCELGPSIPLHPNPDGFIGSWSGPGVNGNQFSPEGLQGSIELMFQPAAGVCAQATNTSIFVVSALTPDLQVIPNLCANESPIALDMIQDGISGIWTGPGVLNNIFSPLGLSGNIALDFIVDADQCANNAGKIAKVFPVQTPLLDHFSAICNEDPPLSLPRLQDQILGDWNGPGVENNLFDPTDLSGIITLEFLPEANQCAEPNRQMIEVGTSPEVSIIANSPSCFGMANGKLELIIDGGKAPYLIDWDNDGFGDFNDPFILTDLEIGNYSARIIDEIGCLAEMTMDLEQPDELSVSLVTIHESQAGARDGEIKANVKGGTQPYKFEWDSGITGDFISNLGAGKYRITITDDNGCQVSELATINSGNCALSTSIQSTNPSCHGSTDGSVEITVQGGLSPLHFQWSHIPTADTSRVMQLPAGNYEVTISDAGGCEEIQSLQIDQPDTLLSLLNVFPLSTAGSSDAMISVKTTGGTEPYRWQWSNGDSTDLITGLLPGIYRLTTTDALGCIHVEETQIEGFDCAVNLQISTKPASCASGLDGEIEVTVFGSTPPMKFSWSHDNTLDTNIVTGLASGIYQVTMVDANGCIASDTVAVTAPAPLALSFSTTAPGVDQKDGQIMSQVSGGTPPYFWSWSTGATSPDIDQLDFGTYHLTVTDAGGCSIVESVILSGQIDQDCDLGFTVITDSVSCTGSKDGVAQVLIGSGTSPFSVNWSHDPGEHQMKIEDLAAGTYSVTVTDSDMCEENQVFKIGEPELLRLSFDAENETAIGAKDGYIVVTPFGGTPPYTFEWNTGQTLDSIGSLKPGTYSVTVTDSHGCVWSRSTMINAADCTLLSNVSARAAKCYGEASGTARLDITTLDFPVSIQWSHDTTLTRNVAENLPAGNYSVTITDEIGCRHTWSYTVTEPDSLSLEFFASHQSEKGKNDGSAQVLIQGGTPGYSIFWDNGSNNKLIEDLAPGTYFVAVVDDNGCRKEDSVEIFSSEQCRLEANLSATASGCDMASGSVMAQPLNTRGAPAFRWSTSDLDKGPSVENLAPGTYWVEVEDDFCLARDTISIEVNNIRSISYNLKQSVCDPTANELIVGAVSGGQQPYEYYLDEDQTKVDQPILMQPGIHLLRVLDGTGCVLTDTFTVQSDQLKITRDTTIKKGTTIILEAEYSTDSTGAQYGWRGRSGELCRSCLSISVSPLESETYTFYYRENDGCRFEEKLRVTVSEQDLFYIPNAFTLNGDGLNDAFIVFDTYDLIDEIASLEIFDRRGVRIYQTMHLPGNIEAPGFYQIMQEAIAPQVYIYRAHIRFKQGFERTVTGDFTLLK